MPEGDVPAARLAVFASGGGSNLQALLDRLGVALVISDRADAGALRRAEAAGVPTRVVSDRGRDASAVEADLLEALDAAAIDLVALAGYLRLIPTGVVRRYAGRMLNVHPALLPAFGGKGLYGLRVHQAVLEAGCRVTGVTVHFVDEVYDTGRIVAQWPVPVLPGDTPETLAARVLRVEHALYPAAVAWLAERLRRPARPEAPEPAAATSPGARPDAAFRLTDDAAPAADELRAVLGLP